MGWRKGYTLGLYRLKIGWCDFFFSNGKPFTNLGVLISVVQWGPGLRENRES